MKHTGIIATTITLFILITSILIGVILIHRIGYEKVVAPSLTKYLSEIKKTPSKIKSIDYQTGVFNAFFVRLQDDSGFLFSNISYLNNSGYFAIYFDARMDTQGLIALNDMETNLTEPDTLYVSLKTLKANKSRGIETFVNNLNRYGSLLNTRVENK